MKKFKNKYFLTILISLIIISLIYILKGIYPFGSNSAVWSDMHEQIVAMYYKFYDAVKGNGSLLVDFSAGGAVNLIGVFAYYIISPFSLILLFFPREMILEASSIVIALKIVTASVTCLYFIDRYFEKIKSEHKILLSLLYAFSGYSMIMYVITSWIDIMWMFPLLMVGLKELLDLKYRKVYILTLAISLIFNFYLTLIILVFVIIASFIYLYYFNRKNMKKAIFNLGISTVIGLLISGMILVPSLMEIGMSERAGLDLSELLNSRFGPLSDKISYLFISGPLIGAFLLLLLNYKKHKNVVTPLLIITTLLALPIIIEPVNKMWHFGSYIGFPYRYGFIIIFMFVVAAAYYLENVDNSFELKINKHLGIILTSITVLFTIFVTYKFGKTIRENIYKLTITGDKKVLILLFLVFVLVTITSIALLFKKSRKNTILLYVLIVSNLIFNSYLYVGFYDLDSKLENKYDTMHELYNLKDEMGVYYLKENARDLISNYGMVSGIRTFANFTSLTDKNNFNTLQALGYDSYWMDTESIGGNLFIDTVLGYRYIISKTEIVSDYYDLFKEVNGYKVYKYNKNMPFGYLILNPENINMDVKSVKNSFELSNTIYNAITKKEDIFEIEDLTHSAFLRKGTIIEEEIEIKDSSEVYLELFTKYNNAEKVKTYRSFNIYINDEEYYLDYPDLNRNGVLDLGKYENETIKIRIEVIKDVIVRNISVGKLNLNKYDEFVDNNYKESNVSIDGNKINVEIVGTTESMLLLPIPNLGYQIKGYELQTVFGNFTGIPLQFAKNIIEISYTPKGIFVGIICTLIGLVLLLFSDKLISLLDGNIMYNISYFVYMIMFTIIMFTFYVIGILSFLVSFIHRF